MRLPVVGNILAFKQYDGYFYYLTDLGLDIISEVSKTRYAYVIKSNLTNLSVSSEGVWLADQTNGIWLLPMLDIIAGDNTVNTVLTVSTVTASKIADHAIRDMAAYGKSLAICTATALTIILDYTVLNSQRHLTTTLATKCDINKEVAAAALNQKLIMFTLRKLPTVAFTTGNGFSFVTEEGHLLSAERQFLSPFNLAYQTDTAVVTSNYDGRLIRLYSNLVYSYYSILDDGTVLPVTFPANSSTSFIGTAKGLYIILSKSTAIELYKLTGTEYVLIFTLPGGSGTLKMDATGEYFIQYLSSTMVSTLYKFDIINEIIVKLHDIDNQWSGGITADGTWCTANPEYFGVCKGEIGVLEPVTIYKRVGDVLSRLPNPNYANAGIDARQGFWLGKYYCVMEITDEDDIQFFEVVNDEIVSLNKCSLYPGRIVTYNIFSNLLYGQNDLLRMFISTADYFSLYRDPLTNQLIIQPLVDIMIGRCTAIDLRHMDHGDYTAIRGIANNYFSGFLSRVYNKIYFVHDFSIINQLILTDTSCFLATDNGVKGVPIAVHMDTVSLTDTSPYGNTILGNTVINLIEELNSVSKNVTAIWLQSGADIGKGSLAYCVQGSPNEFNLLDLTGV